MEKSKLMALVSELSNRFDFGWDGTREDPLFKFAFETYNAGFRDAMTMATEKLRALLIQRGIPMDSVDDMIERLV